MEERWWRVEMAILAFIGVVCKEGEEHNIFVSPSITRALMLGYYSSG